MRTKRPIARWSLMAGALITLFWVIWYLCAGSVPAVTAIKLAENRIYTLPFGLSHWWDILLGSIWVAIFIVPAAKLKNNGFKAGLAVVLTLGIFFGLAYGLILGLAVSLVFGLALGLIIGLFLGLIFGPVFDKNICQALGLVFGLAAGLAFVPACGFGLALVFSLALGLGISMTFRLGVCLTVGLAVLIKLIRHKIEESMSGEDRSE
jgi:hypothetical protein